MERTQILEEIGKMSVLELSQLIKDMEEKFGVSAAAATVVAGPAAGGAAAAAPAEEKTEFTVMLNAAGEKKGTATRPGREGRGWGLRKPKDFAAGGPRPGKEGGSK